MTTETKTDLKSAILHHLQYGKQSAMTGKVLSQRCGERGTRAMRQAIRELVQNGYLIGLSPRPPYGYYLIETPEELQECMATLQGYCVNAALHRRDLKRAASQRLFGQRKMTL